MNTNVITLGGLLSTIVSTKPITINLFDQDDLLIITFIKDGYAALEDIIEADPVTKIEIINMFTVNVTIDTTGN